VASDILEIDQRAILLGQDAAVDGAGLEIE
jgi:hypothetical protein